MGTILIAYIVGVILSLSGFMEMEEEHLIRLEKIQTILQSICIPLAIPLMLFSSNIKEWFKSFNKTLVSFSLGIIAIVAAVLLSVWVFKSFEIEELWKTAGIMVGFYTGGTPNVASLKLALAPSAQTFLLVNSFQIIVNFIFLVFLIFGGFKVIRWMFGEKKSSAENIALDKKELKEFASSFEDYSGMYAERRPLGFALLCSLIIFAIGGASGFLVGPDYRIVLIILSITSLAIGASFIKKIRETKKTFELGMYFVLIFSLLIASQFKIDQVNASTLPLLGFITFIVVFGVSLHGVLCKLFKVNADLFTISSVALLFSPPFVPTVAGLMNNKKVMISGIVVGLLGYAVGNYLGIATAQIVKMFIL